MTEAGDPGAAQREDTGHREPRGKQAGEQSTAGFDLLAFARCLEGNTGTTEQGLLILRHWISGARR